MLWGDVKEFFSSAEKKGDTGDLPLAFLHFVSILHSAFTCISFR